MSEIIRNWSWTWRLFGINVCILSVYYSIDVISMIYKWYCSKRKGINEAVFMCDQSCLDCIRRRNTECMNMYCYNYTIRKLVSFLNGAQRSIYICMNIFTNQDLGAAVLAAHRRGVNVRVVINDQTGHATGSQIENLHANGIPVRHQNTQNYVHHKFCLLDSDKSLTIRRHDTLVGARAIPNTGVLMSGSMNWTFQAMNVNSENVMITSDSFLVSEFHQEFLRIWNHVNIMDLNER